MQAKQKYRKMTKLLLKQKVFPTNTKVCHWVVSKIVRNIHPMCGYYRRIHRICTTESKNLRGWGSHNSPYWFPRRKRHLKMFTNSATQPSCSCSRRPVDGAHHRNPASTANRQPEGLHSGLVFTGVMQLRQSKIVRCQDGNTAASVTSLAVTPEQSTSRSGEDGIANGIRHPGL